MSDKQRDTSMWPLDVEAAVQQAADTAARTMRQLLPFPGGTVPALPLMPLGRSTNTATATAPPAAVAGTATDVVSRAAKILDDEMARGVLSARNVPSLPGRTNAAGGDILQQLREVIDNVARVWPASAGTGPRMAEGTAAAASAAPPLPELKPATQLRPGDQATIAMTVHNRESGPVSLVPVATPLLGSNGERIAAQLIEFTPAQLQLDPGQQQELRVTITVPARCASGCYSGVMVVGGVDYLRALITVEVRARE
jgi:hypothetical protein